MINLIKVWQRHHHFDTYVVSTRKGGIVLALIIFFLSVLPACGTIQKHQFPSDLKIDRQAVWELHRANLETVKIWSLKGRIAGKSYNTGFRVGIHWRQQQQKFGIDLHGLLGRKVAVITGKAGDVELKTSKGESYSATNSEALMQSLFGYSLPVNGLHFWMRGIPDPEQVYASLELDDQGRLKQLIQAGWLIDYNRYHDSNPALPAFIKISNKTLNANIVIDHWLLNAIEH